MRCLRNTNVNIPLSIRFRLKNFNRNREAIKTAVKIAPEEDYSYVLAGGSEDSFDKKTSLENNETKKHTSSKMALLSEGTAVTCMDVPM